MDEDNSVPSLGGRTKALVVLLILGIITAVVTLGSAWLQYELLGRDYTEKEADANDSRQQVVGLAQTLLRLATVVVFGMWIYRANNNVRALGARDLRYTPGWAVGWFFVPILNLWKPYQAMSDLWRASRRPADWMRTSAGPILGLWWALWLASNIAGNISFRAGLRAKTVEEIRAVTVIDMISEGLDVPLCLIAIALVTQITGFQKEAAERSVDEADLSSSPTE